ncbi:PP2C family serine/threonine-protein phosphatase [Asanoa sp. NPDC050611]|uniref:PP2C family serine/threonine-protein phosphatase n=1 Tax=Asanoa sp. NPDC050611 TaxID=3157098 RepID=UPI0033DACC0C
MIRLVRVSPFGRVLAGVCALLVVPLVALLGGCGVRPSGVITGGPAPTAAVGGTRIYLLSDGEPTLVLRGGKPIEPTEVLRMLAAGPTDAERAQGFTTEVPSELAPAKIGFDAGSTLVSVSTDVGALSVLAVVQIVCTVQAMTVATPATPVTLVSDGQRRGPLSCPRYP